MKRKRKVNGKSILCLILTVMLLTACSGQTKSNGGNKNFADSEKSYFQGIWRADVKYSEMEYEHCGQMEFNQYADVLRGFAEEGKASVSFYDAYYNIWEELQYVYTMMTLAELELMADSDNEALSEEYQYTFELYQDLYDEYLCVMNEIAVSPYKEVMTEVFHESYLEWFAAYIPYTEEEKELLAYSEENMLIQEYYAVMAEEEPDEDILGGILTELIALRNQQARLFGYESYAEAAYVGMYGRDYLPKEAETIWQGVKEYIVPVYQKYRDTANENIEMLLEAEDLDCSPQAIIEAMDQVIPYVSSELYRAFCYMKVYELYDIDCDPQKSDIGFTTRLYYYNQPFIFNAATDEFVDYQSMIHEFGHFANAFYTQSDLLFGLADNDICELQSQGFEMIMSHYYEEIFGTKYAEAAKYYVLMTMLQSVIEGALQDELQQKIYAEKNVTAERITEIYRQLYEEYGYRPYDGYEKEWMWIPHNYEMPFYQISYSISALGALQLYGVSCDSLAEGVDKYLTICAVDTEMYYFSELLGEIGFKDVFDVSWYGEIADIFEKSFAQQ